jgi:excisionase family DNA binding protein
MLDESYVSIGDLAKHFAVSISTVRVWIRTNRIPAFKLGGVYRFKLSEVEAALRGTRRVKEEPKVDVYNPDEDL